MTEASKFVITQWEAEQQLTPEKLVATFEDWSKGMLVPLTWIELCSLLNITEEELEDKASTSPLWRRLVALYKQKCKASLLSGIKKNPQALLRYYELEHVERSIDFDGEEWPKNR